MHFFFCHLLRVAYTNLHETKRLSVASSGSDNGQVRFRWTSVKRQVNVKSEYELFVGGCETCQQSKSYPYNSALWRCEIVRYKWQWIKSDRSEVKLPKVSQTLKDTNKLWSLCGNEYFLSPAECRILDSGAVTQMIQMTNPTKCSLSTFPRRCDKM